MMKAEELRIGNWVNYKSTLSNIFPIRVGIGTITEIIERPDSPIIEPLLITEEIILECTFVKMWHLSSFEYVLYIDESMSLTAFYDSSKLIIKMDLSQDQGKEFIDSCTRYFYEIKHLHQLQNLYFALTGEELEIEL